VDYRYIGAYWCLDLRVGRVGFSPWNYVRMDTCYYRGGYRRLPLAVNSIVANNVVRNYILVNFPRNNSEELLKERNVPDEKPFGYDLLDTNERF